MNSSDQLHSQYIPAYADTRIPMDGFFIGYHSPHLTTCTNLNTTQSDINPTLHTSERISYCRRTYPTIFTGDNVVPVESGFLSPESHTTSSFYYPSPPRGSTGHGHPSPWLPTLCESNSNSRHHPPTATTEHRSKALWVNDDPPQPACDPSGAFLIAPIPSAYHDGQFTVSVLTDAVAGDIEEQAIATSHQPNHQAPNIRSVGTERITQAARRRRLPAGTGSNQKLYECTLCGATLTSYLNWRGHTNSHQDLKPYACREHNKAYSHKQSLQRHLRIFHADLVGAPRRTSSLYHSKIR